MIRILIVDDHKLFRQGVQALLMGAQDMQIVGEARDGQEGIELGRRLQPDVILMDLGMPRLDGFQATESLLAGENPPKILVLSMRSAEEDVRRAAQLGARGFLIKNKGRDELVNAIRAVYSGRVACSPEVSPFFAAAGGPVDAG